MDLRGSQRRFRELCNALPGIVWTASAAGRISFVNDEWLRYTGLSARAKGAPTPHPEDRVSCARRWRDAVRGGTEFEAEARYPRYDGAYRWFLSRATPSRDAAGCVEGWFGIMTDIHEHKLAQEALRASEERFRLATEAVAGFLYDWDLLSNRVERFGGTKEVVGFALQDVTPDIGWWIDRIHPDDLPNTLDAVRGALSGVSGQGYTFVYRLLHRDGRYVRVADRGRIVRNETGRAVRVLGGVSDISERWRLEDERAALLERERDARRLAEDAVRARDRVLGVVSHDLRNSLSAVALCANALAESTGPDSGNSHKILEAIRHAAESMSRLINDLLDVASIEAGRLAVERRVQPSAAMMDDVSQMFSVLASDRGITLEWPSPGEVPPVWADADRILQALANLVANAIKFTEPGGRIILSVESDPRGVRFAVRDNGAGIAADDLPHVFDRFWQKPRSSRERGAGLGLAIVRGIVDAHGGRLVVASTQGKGSEFSFTIPAAN